MSAIRARRCPKVNRSSRLGVAHVGAQFGEEVREVFRIATGYQLLEGVAVLAPHLRAVRLHINRIRQRTKDLHPCRVDRLKPAHATQLGQRDLDRGTVLTTPGRGAASPAG